MTHKWLEACCSRSVSLFVCLHVFSWTLTLAVTFGLFKLKCYMYYLVWKFLEVLYIQRSARYVYIMYSWNISRYKFLPVLIESSISKLYNLSNFIWLFVYIFNTCHNHRHTTVSEESFVCNEKTKINRWTLPVKFILLKCFSHTSGH